MCSTVWGAAPSAEDAASTRAAARAIVVRSISPAPASAGAVLGTKPVGCVAGGTRCANSASSPTNFPTAANRAEVIRTFRAALARDKTPTQVFDISELGLVEMTRKRVGEGLVEVLSETCPVCNGRGIVFAGDTTQ